MQDPDIVVIGSGPNGLAASLVLAGLGCKVLVLESNPRRPGGSLGSDELTLPGFTHDVGAGFFPFGKLSPAFLDFELERHGLEWRHARFESCHPGLDGSFACISRDLEESRARFGSLEDGETWHELASFYRRIERDLISALMSPFPALGPAFRVGAPALLRVASLFARSLSGTSRELFRTEAARRVLPSLALHVDVGPDDAFGTGLGFMLGMTATTGGYAVPRGGAQRLTDAMVTLLEHRGGRLQLGARVKKVVVREGRAAAVLLESGEEIAVRRGVLADSSAPALFLDLLERKDVPRFVVQKMRRFPQGFGTFKLDWALSRPVPWRVQAARESAVVHVGESLDDLSRFVRQIRAFELPDRPYLVLGQHTLADPSRAPEGKHTLYCYSRVPPRVDKNWSEASAVFAERVEQRIEELAPGFRASILGRSTKSPLELEAQNENLRAGDLGGGTNAWHNQLLFRPVFPYFRYRTPVRGLYLCSSYAHPGAGVHGMCGYNAAQIAARDLL